MSQLIFVNLPVRDLPASRAFFEALDFSFDDRFCDEGAACMVVSDQAWVMLLERERFADFVTKPVADPAEATALTVAVSAESREAVDAFARPRSAPGRAPARGPRTTASCTSAASTTSTATSGR